MLRIAFIPLLTLALFACERSAGSKLIGSWQAHTEDMGGQIRFAANHTFTSHEWDATNFVPDTGDWQLSGDKFVLDFPGDAPSRSTESSA